ncbi:hypothetical protein D9V28_13835 [Mycetocola zhadangensis]|uniref:Uncharacterized protein n=2 Tax=Mycetocola zhadangensis TaxID=1164595 RepID=A0A3L7ITI2_9MICO|nr:hypothetical protein D9V28_13835 [Mycetocola zhadangensis]
MTEETLLLGNISTDQLTQQHITPPALTDAEYVATLSTTSPGAPSYVIGQRVSGKPYDQIILSYGPTQKPWQRVWRLSADRGAHVDYQIVHDTSSTGFASVER